MLDATDQAGDAYDLPIAVGDRVRLYSRTHARGAGAGLLGLNGSVVEVRGIETDGLILRSEKGREGLVPWGTLRDPETGRIRLGPGDCRSLASAQGSTAEECIVAMPRGSAGVNAGAFYVAMTRHRSVSWLVLGEGAERRAVAARRSIGDATPIRATDLWKHAAATFTRRAESEGALDLLDRGGGGPPGCRGRVPARARPPPSQDGARLGALPPCRPWFVGADWPSPCLLSPKSSRPGRKRWALRPPRPPPSAAG